MKLSRKFGKLADRIQAKIGGRSASASPSNSNQASIDSASAARNPGPGNNAGQTEQTSSGSHATLSQNPIAPSQPAPPPPSNVPVVPGSDVGQGHGGETTPASVSVAPVATTGGGRADNPGGSPTFPTADAVGHQVQDSDWKSTTKDVLVIAWTGMEMLLKKVEKCLDGTPAKMPVAAVNALIEIKNAVGDNKGAIEQLIIQTADRLLAVDDAVGRDVPNSLKPQMVAFVATLRTEIDELKKLAGKRVFRRVLENEGDKKAVEDRFKRIDGATKTFQIGIAIATERKVDDIHSEVKLMQLASFRARKAIYDADLGGGATVTREACTLGTREGILEDIVRWADDTSDDSPPVFWLTGNAGSGKTTIAYTIAQHFEKLEKTEHASQHAILGASFHCSRQFEETRRQIHIIPTLVYELARKSGSFRHALHEADKFDSVDKLDKQVEDLLAGPWQQSVSQRHAELPSYLIVVDALDEIEAQGGSGFLCGMLETIKKHHLQGLKFLFTSRPDPSVIALFDPSVSKLVYRLQDVPITSVETDIAKFLQSKLPNLEDQKELEDMVQLADGLFISAATIVRYLTPHWSIRVGEQRKRLHKLHVGQSFAASSGLLIDKLYQQILYDAFSAFDDDLFNSRLAILHTFLCTFERTSTSVTAALLSEFDMDVQVVDAVLETLYAVLYCKNGQVLWYHASFPDFIFNEMRSNFVFEGCQFSMACKASQHHALLTKSCFSIMKKSLHFNIGDIQSSFLLDAEDLQLAHRVNANINAFLRYSSQHWSYHLSQTNKENGKDFSALMTDFLCIYVLFWIEAMNLLGFSGQCSTMLQYTHEWVLKNTNGDVGLAANILEAANFATYFRANPPALSTPHLYISALATWSTGSALSQQWKKKFPGIPAFTHRKPSDTPLIKIQTGSSVKSVAFSSDGTHIVSGLLDRSVRVWDASTGAQLQVLNGHSGTVNSVAFSSDGTHIVSGSHDNSVRVWDASTGAQLQVLTGHSGTVNSVAFSSDGTHIVSGSDDNSVQVWDASTGAQLQVLNGHTHWVNSVAFSSDGTHIVSGSHDHSVWVWDASTGAELQMLNGHTGPVKSVAFSSDGTHIVSGSLDRSVQVWDASTGAQLQVLNGHTSWVNSVAFSSDGTHIVSGSHDNSVQVWDVSTGAQLQVLNGHSGIVNSVAFSSDGTHIVSGSHDRSVRVWDASTSAQLQVLNGHTSCVNSVAFSSDGTHIVSGSHDNSVRVWDASTGAQLQVLNGHSGTVNSVAFSSDGTHIVSGSDDNSVQVWDASTGAQLQVLNGHTHWVKSVAFSSDGTHIVSGSLDRSVQVWDVSTGAQLQVLNGHTDWVRSVAFSSDGTHIVSGSLDRSVQVWDASTGAQLQVLNGHTSWVNSVAFSSDGTHIVSGSHDNSVQVWDVSTGAQLQVLNGHSGIVNSVAFSSDGTHIVSGSHDRSVRVWDASTSAQLQVLNGHTSCVNSVAFSSDGTHIVSGSHDNSVRVWDASTGAQLQVLNGHSGTVNSVAFSSDGTHIVSGSDDNSVQVWDASTGAQLQVLNGHTHWVKSVAFSSDGTHIVSGSLDRSVQVWDVSTGAQLQVLNGHTDWVRSVAFSSDGTHIVSGSDDESVRVWDASTGAELQMLNGHTGRVRSVAFSSDGTHIVSGSYDHSVWVWDASTGAQLQVLNGHSGTVNSVAFSSDGTHIVSGSDDNSVQVWDVSTGAQLQVLNGHSGTVNSVAFSSDGTHIVSGSHDNTVQVWHVPMSPSNTAVISIQDNKSAWASIIK
ncbi:hypothetical protein D9619_008898 [Psilocybe cf. subviscida]|uniref:Nephrocystin 3-like N-terminal domain-containing protein n=1 Tax=Psilocybe cf. subviscida TaxID=2480587 RepID=A0A8H5B9Y3_9AGAR|nr:hypothetical protein D9619_008898 [Psilocybe cf. subviscida]